MLDMLANKLCIVTMCLYIFSFLNDTATTEIYTLSLHDALPISHRRAGGAGRRAGGAGRRAGGVEGPTASSPPTAVHPDRKSTRLNSSHANISYAVFCLKKKKIPVIINKSPQNLYYMNNLRRISP